MEKSDFPETIFVEEAQIHPTAFIAEGARVIGNVVIKTQASIWYNCVLRGDINRITVGERTNIQDGSILHLENDRACTVGNDVTVGHNAIIHGCTIEDGALIGMGAIILNGAVIKRGAVVGAGAVVKENEIVEENSLVVGIPAKKVRDLGESSYTNNVKWAKKYCKLAESHKLRQV